MPHIIKCGDTKLEVNIPPEWNSPFRDIRSSEYFISNARIPIDKSNKELEITGESFYIDVSTVSDETKNQQNIETLIHGIFGCDNLSGRQKFFVSLVSLQSYFEYLVYGMLITSKHITKSKFDKLNNHKFRTKEAFSNSNKKFFTDEVEIHQGKDSVKTDIASLQRDELEKIFIEVCALRNKIVHNWGTADIGKDVVKEIFFKLGENIDLNISSDQFYYNASYACIRLYAKSSSIKNQLSLFNEKKFVEFERKSRGY